ncbi:MAG: hypothetical protein ACQGVC_12770 [Myxococcota bacterium]
MAELPEDARARVSAEFAGETYYEALRQLEVLDFPPRVLRSVIHLARGDLEELRLYARAAERDPRQVVFWAEYEDHDAPEPRRVRSMDEPFPGD